MLGLGFSATGMAAWQRIARAMVVGAWLVGVAGCATTMSDGSVQLSPIPASDFTIGAREHPKVVAAYGGVYQSERLQRYLDDMAERLAEESPLPDVKYTVTVLNSPSLNAFSLPGGYLYLTRGLLALANDDAEIATVLSHEMAHVIRRHAIAREAEANTAATVSRVINDVVRDPSAGAKALALTQGRLAQFSRIQEREADRMGIRMAAKAGYDPEAAVRFLTALDNQTALHAKLLNHQNDAGRVELLATHPSTPERIAAAVAQARAQQGGESDRGAYLAALNGILYGDDPREGYVRGRRFVHPVLGLTFMLPEGFGLENTPRAVVGVSAAGDIIRFDGISIPRERSLAVHLRRNTVRNGVVDRVSETVINNFPMAIADVKSAPWIFRVALIRARGNDVYRFIMAVKNMTPERAAAFEEAIRSFRFITPAEAALARPLRIAVAKVGRGDSAASLAARMALPDRQMERFLVLNGFASAADVKPGMQIKLVVE